VEPPDDPQVDLDALAARLPQLLELDPEEATEVVVTLAEHHDRRVIAPLIDLLASGRANELMVRGAGWMADPALHRPLVNLAASLLGAPVDSAYAEQVDRAIGRCDPRAATEAEEVEIELLVAAQAALVEAGAVLVEVALEGQYPTTEVVLSIDEHQRRHPIWNFDITNPDDPRTLDRPFARYRIAQLATWG
jgi:hypothetical protein